MDKHTQNETTNARTTRRPPSILSLARADTLISSFVAAPGSLRGTQGALPCAPYLQSHVLLEDGFGRRCKQSRILKPEASTLNPQP